jgi:hypothetical protein
VDKFMPQGIGEVDFRNDTGNVLLFLPIGQSGLVVFKAGATGAYIIPNASDPGGNFATGDFIQEAGILAATDAVELDGAVYFHRDGRFYVMGGDGQVAEVGYPVRGTTITGTLTADYTKKLIIAVASASSAFAYDVQGKRWMKYDAATSLFTSRALISPTDHAPLTVHDVAFDYEFTDTADAQLVFSTRYDARDWSDDQTVDIVNERSTHNYKRLALAGETGVQFQLRITTLPTNLKVREIMVNLTGYTPESRRS